MSTKKDVVIRGIAHRGACDPEIATFVAGASLAADTLPLYPQLHQHTVIGSAEVQMRESGDIAVTATIPERYVNWLVGFPFLSVTIDDPEGGPRQVVQISVTDNVLDPFQLPYRIVEFTEAIQSDFANGYDPVVVVDEKHESQILLNADGSVVPIFDTAKTHIELRNRTERLRTAIPDAIARGFGFNFWTSDLEKCNECNEPPMTLRVLREVMQAL